FFFAEVWLLLTAYRRRGSSILTAERLVFINQYLQDCCDLSNYESLLYGKQTSLIEGIKNIYGVHM
ncbi:uncharacterized protein BX663DRAFT_522775, partial [Cokeromyces recurvatus]|uniref:uncharacterized protein n=1 Tax=Cokeromyces recurvatus TaxID=90255 RepID=UPI00221E6ED6